MAMLSPLLTNASVKGNSGKGRFRRQSSRLAVVVVICIIVIGISEWRGGGLSQSRSGHETTKDRLRKASVRKAEEIFRPVNSSGGLSEKEKIDLVISGQVHLSDLQIAQTVQGSSLSSSYNGIKAVFCKLNWSLHKSDPSSFPMFRDLIEHSHCNQNSFSIDLGTVIKAVRSHDDNQQSDNDENVHVMKPNGFVFHESRCGSTLVANSLAALEPSITRVYSESTPPMKVLRACGTNGQDCSTEVAIGLLRDVIYLMGRTNDVNESQLFFKIQSIGSKSIGLFNQAFPDTPWIYVYRDSVQVLMSQLAHGPESANCVRQLREVPRSRMHLLQKQGKVLHKLQPEEKCALHFSLLLESASTALRDTGTLGRPVNYDNLVDKLINHVIPEHFMVMMTNERKQNILDVSSTYSKGRGSRHQEWEEDSDKKEEHASPAIRKAAELYLDEYYNELESLGKLTYYGELED